MATSHLMIPALIFVASAAACAQFLIFYTRSLLSASRKIAVSETALRVAGIDGDAVGGDEFRSLFQLLHVCPSPEGHELRVHAVKAYFSMLRPIRIAAKISPRLASWVESERGDCARYMAVTLDRRITFVRELMAQQAASRF